MSCPACGSPDSKPHFYRLDMEIRRCEACGMMFQGPGSAARLDRELIENIYREYVGHAQQHLLLNADRLERLARLLGRPLNGLRVLEIGAGNGALGSLLLKAGADYTGIEPLPLCREAAGRLFPELAARLIPEKFQPGQLPPGSFDLILATDTLEHMEDPLLCATALPGLLAPGGKVYLEVPNEALLWFKGRLRIALGMYGRGYPTNPEHLSLFTRRTFGLFLRNAGLKPLALFQDSVWGNPSRIKIAFNGAPPPHILAASWFFRLTRLDLLLQQGVLATLAEPAAR